LNLRSRRRLRGTDRGDEIVVHRFTDQVAELFEPRQIANVVESEVDEKLFRRAIEERTADDVLASGDANHSSLEQRTDRARRVDAANVGDLRRGHRLAIRDDRERLQSGERKTVLPFFREVLFQNGIVLGARGETPSARGLLENESADVLVEVLLDLVELRDDGVASFIGERFGEVVDLHRLGGDEENGFDGGT